ncbi:hypothetical protein ElyMa_004032000 [Elysia marginata]|uniref:Uncharacterized protein n=1 Tax=Elysia marginata TaxID=1093978 RepID=A0AAV4G5P6_9GAST|nr:hypothetical protein ElyMa_004032000 [Elysia marginata]
MVTNLALHSANGKRFASVRTMQRPSGQRRFIAQQALLLFETLDKDSEIDGNSSDDKPAASAASDTSSVSEQSIATPPPQSLRRNVSIHIVQIFLGFTDTFSIHS